MRAKAPITSVIAPSLDVTPPPRRLLRLLAPVLALIGAALALGYATPASAHTIGLSTGEYKASGSSLVATLALARAEILSLAPAMDVNRDGHLTPSEVAASRTLVKAKLLDRIVVTSGGPACKAVLTDVGLTEEDGLLVSGRWECASAGEPFSVDLAFLQDVVRGHRHIARTVVSRESREPFAAGEAHDEVLDAGHRSLVVAADPSSSSSPAHEAHVERGDPQPAGASGFGAFLAMGVEHILGGYDHLLFVLGLVLARSRMRSLLAVVTAFTIAHSLTLALAVFDLWSPSGRLVEPLIALSLVYVGVENIARPDGGRRWALAFAFGLVHGFGFAGALKEVALAGTAIGAALLSFNVGVEIGQLLVLAVFLPIVALLRDKPWFGERGVRVLSGLVALAGVLWFVSRVLHR